ncbi:MAG: non-homologous end-joining DNA ligase, partial [Acidimicrobiales bacterium]
LWSRNHNSFTRRFPEVAVELAALPAASFALDGELVAVERGEVVGFSALQRPGGDTRTAFAAFDLVHVLGRDVTRLGLADRKRLLAGTVACGARVQTVEMLTGGASSLFQMACAQGWEGLVAKRSGSTYVSGRSGNWRKLKCSASQELVVGGWTEPRGARSGFGALLVGYYERGLLRYAGKVGTGFSEAVLRELHGRLESLARPASPFADQVRERGAHWVEPALVAAVAFTEWTTDGRLRHPRYQGLRTDKDPWSVMRELPAQHGRSKELR